MKTIIFKIFFVLLFISCNKAINDKTNESFEKHILNMEIIKREGVSSKDFEFGKIIIERIRSKAKEKSFQFKGVDYWNVTTAQISLKGNEDDIRYSFKRAFELNPRMTCLMVEIKKAKKDKKYYEFQRIIPNFNVKCNEYFEKHSDERKEIDNYMYANKNGFDIKLIELIYEILRTDQKYRGTIAELKKNLKAQSFIDNNNQKKIDSLYNIYKKYIGKTMVGDEYKLTMWLVIQHSNIKMMKKYIPVIHQAVKDNELPQGSLKLLIDRISTVEHGYQIFGSQGSDIEIAKEIIRNKIKKQYDIE